MTIILASKSPRRKELLENAQAKIIICPSDAKEDIEEKDPAELVMKLSSIKAESVFEQNPDLFTSLESEKSFILGADTVVYAGGMILGKPADKNEARDMIKLLSGSVHSVFTGFTILFEDGKKITDYAETRVFVYPMSDEEIEDYISTDEPYDKAGAYGIQGLFGRFVEKIEGDYNNVVGLPVSKILHTVKEYNI